MRWRSRSRCRGCRRWERGLVRAGYEPGTLRGHLGLPVPENRYTAARRDGARRAAEEASPGELSAARS